VHARLAGILVLGQGGAVDHGDDGLAKYLLVTADDGARGTAAAAALGPLE